jgi:acyl-CoA synthetase (AMP-forming)/AMP-acid ligase II
VKSFVEVLRARASGDAARRGFSWLVDGEAPARLSYAELDTAARALAVTLGERRAREERVLIVLDPGLAYVSALFGCLYAGALAVPLYPPDPLRPAAGIAHLERVAERTRARLILSTAAWRQRLLERIEPASPLRALEWFDMDAAGTSGAERWIDPGVAPEAIALLQFTSGSTAEPKGVAVSHANLLANARAIEQAFELTPESRGVSWLPPYHDMGLMGGILQPVYLGADTGLMSPQAFLQRPARWLKAISERRATTCGAPNFAYDLLARRVPEATKAGLDLRSWSVAFCGAEPVRAETLDAFAAAFEVCGFRREAFLPCYGLAEATLLVTGTRGPLGPCRKSVDVVELESGRAVALDAAGGAQRTLVGAGRPAAGIGVRIVDPDTARPCDPGTIGEIWVEGPAVASCYWEDARATAETFGAALAEGGGRFLRTGDLGFTSDGDLFVTGRLKDLLIVRGRNIYPQDVEESVQRAHPDVRPGRVVAFHVDGGDGEALVVTCEIARRVKGSHDEIEHAIRTTLATEHGLLPSAVVLLGPGELPRTSSGKPRRQACRALFALGKLGGGQEP